MRWAVLVLLVTIRTVCVCVPVCAIHCCCLSAVFHAPYSPSGFFFFFLFLFSIGPFGNVFDSGSEIVTVFY